MLVRDNEFNFFWTVLIICLSSAVVALGIRDLNRYYRPVSQQVSRQEMHALALALHGHVNIKEAARRRRRMAKDASSARQSEFGSVLRFMKSLVP